MKQGDIQKGMPEIVYTDTKANIEALTGVIEGATAYATDTHEPGWYNGAAWVWGAGGGSGVTRNGNTTDHHLAVWNGNNADSIEDGGVVPVGGGDVYGDAAATDEHLAVFDGDGYHIKDGGAVPVGAYPQGARVYNNANSGVITSGVVFPVPFNSESWDTDGIHDNGVNNTRLTCQTTGKYLVHGQARFGTGAGGGTVRQVQIRLDGASLLAIVQAHDAVLTAFLEATTICELVAGHYIELLVHHDSGNNTGVVEYGAGYSPVFSIQRIG
jgi:hypothetical protein